MDSVQPRVLVIGGSGFIGGRLTKATSEAGYPTAYTYSREPVALLNVPGYQLTFGSADSGLETCLQDFHPDIVVYSAVPPVLSEYALHEQVSVEGVKQTIEALGKLAPDSLLIYLSTNMVFANGHGRYREDEIPDAQLRTDTYRSYAMTKAAGELLVLETWPNSLVVRTSIVDGRDLAGQLNPRLAALVERLQAEEDLPRFKDRYITPTLLDNFLDALLETFHFQFQYRGVMHIAGSQRITDYEYGRSLARTQSVSPNLIIADSIKNAPAMAGGPADTSLSIDFTQSLLRTRLLNVEEQLVRLFGQAW